ncbi:MAG: dTMP kinase [Wenzhouxiangellaceae bacterium]|nr:MAG: dTMP kinase [Wenzhouxiangellaceae bacterium]
MRGRLITLEGGEGAGKSTAVRCVADWLERHGRSVILTREPGGTRVAEQIRALLLDPDTGELAPMTELLLMFAARAENLARIIRPALEAGQDVICDRFTDASRAYQGGGRELGTAAVDALAGLVHPDLGPDLTLLLDVPVAIGMARVDRRGQPPDRFEQARAGFLDRVRSTYLDIAEREPQRMVVIDASAPLAEVHAAIVTALEERL